MAFFDERAPLSLAPELLEYSFIQMRLERREREPNGALGLLRNVDLILDVFLGRAP
jgi:hypothetical protein